MNIVRLYHCSMIVLSISFILFIIHETGRPINLSCLLEVENMNAVMKSVTEKEDLNSLLEPRREIYLFC